MNNVNGHLILTCDLQTICRPELVYGPGSVQRIGELAQQIGAQRVLLVTDAGIVQAGHAQQVEELLTDARLAVETFDQVIENPTTVCVENCAAVVLEHQADTIIGLGGGSAIDTAKGANFIATNGGVMRDYQGFNHAAKSMLPLIAIPTTAGTGSETQSYALISDTKSHRKMACGDEKAMPVISVLDANLTLTQPHAVAMHSGIDAVSHAIESAVSTNSTDESLMYSRLALSLTMPGLFAVIHDGTEINARQNLQLGAAYGGMAIERSMLGAAHATANPLTANYGIVHGEAVGVMLPHVMRFNDANETAHAVYNQLADELGLVDSDELIDQVIELLKMSGMALSLEQLNVPIDDIKLLATEASQQWTGQFNPRAVTVAEFEALYEAAWQWCIG